MGEDQIMFTMTAYPVNGPYERWELTVQATGEVLLRGNSFPIDLSATRAACDAYRARTAAEAERIRQGVG